MVLGRYPEARAILEQLKESDPSDMDVQYNLAGVELLSGHYTAAAEAYTPVYNAGQRSKASAATGLGISVIMNQMSVTGSTSDAQAIFRGIAYFREAVCLQPGLRGVFIGGIPEGTDENYEGYSKFLQRLQGGSEYDAFLADLRAGKTC